MRMARIKLRGRSAVYHCMSRVVGGQRLLDGPAREQLATLARRLARFCGVELITYCIMPNHFHVLVRVPEGGEPTDAELLARVEGFYGKRAALTALVREGMSATEGIPRDLRAGLVARMGDVSGYMKELKQRFSRWFNRRHERFGTLWAERFKSVVVEDGPGPVGTMASYIDLNPVRAGMVEDPAQYRFSGYGAAVAGEEQMRAGLMSVEGAETWQAGAGAYRRRLYVRAGTSGGSGKAVLSREAIQRELARGGKLSGAEVLRLRIRYLTDGVALGSREFVEEVFGLHREKFGAKRRSGARPLRGVPLPGLHTLRDLRLRAVT